MRVKEMARGGCLELRCIYIRLGNTRWANIVDGVLIHVGLMGWR